jgi:hypothetical protein
MVVKMDPTPDGGGFGGQPVNRQQQAQDIQAIGVSTTPTAAAEDPPVYWPGYGPGGPDGGYAPDNPLLDTIAGRGYQESTRARSDALQQVFAWYGTPKYQELVDYLVKLGLLSKGDSTNIQKVAMVWGDAVDVAAALGPSKRIDPWNAAKLLQTSDEDGAASGAGGGGDGPKTQTSTSVNLTDPKTAKGLINNAMTQALGRAATEEEIAEFVDALHAQQYANPQTSTSTYNADGSQVSTTSSGGVDAGQIALEAAQSEDDYAEVQAGTTYFNALMSMVGENG